MTSIQAYDSHETGLSVARIEHTAQQIEMLETLADRVLVPGVDYGIIPGTDKPSLLKPGAEAIIGAINCYTRPRLIEQKVDPATGFYYVLYSSEVVSRATGEVVVSGIGSCTSYEKKYRYRKGKPFCPQCKQETIQASKFKDEFYCWQKIGGCGATFPSNNEHITSQSVGMVENEDLLDQVNTFDKMAEKRADVDAALKLPGVARKFTQDMAEDSSHDDPDAHQSNTKPSARGKAPTRPSQGTKLGNCETHNRPWANTKDGVGHPLGGGAWCYQDSAEKDTDLGPTLNNRADLELAVVELGWQWDEFVEKIVESDWEEWLKFCGGDEKEAVSIAWQRFQTKIDEDLPF